jgi:LAO/AO transport system kinase
MVQVFDAAGFEIIMIETVGAGQAEVDIARLAHTTLVVEAPGMGDEIQAIKAGILEIADILVVNKADRPGVENTERALRSMLELAHPTPRVFKHHGMVETVASPDQETDNHTIWVPPSIMEWLKRSHRRIRRQTIILFGCLQSCALLPRKVMGCPN